MKIALFKTFILYFYGKTCSNLTNMTTGESLFTIAILGVFSYGIYLIHKKRQWKLMGKIIGVAALISLLISAVVYGYNLYKDRPTIQTELADISLGMKKVDVTLVKGKPDSENISDEGVTTLQYKDYSGNLQLFINLDAENNEVYRICSLEFYDEVFGLGEYDSLEKVISKLGEPEARSINNDGTMMIVTYPQYNVAFQIHEGDVNMTCVTTQEKMGYVEEYSE